MTRVCETMSTRRLDTQQWSLFSAPAMRDKSLTGMVFIATDCRSNRDPQTSCCNNCARAFARVAHEAQIMWPVQQSLRRLFSKRRDALEFQLKSSAQTILMANFADVGRSYIAIVRLHIHITREGKLTTAFLYCASKSVGPDRAHRAQSQNTKEKRQCEMELSVATGSKSFYILLGKLSLTRLTTFRFGLDRSEPDKNYPSSYVDGVSENLTATAHAKGQNEFRSTSARLNCSQLNTLGAHTLQHQDDRRGHPSLVAQGHWRLSRCP